MKAVCHACARTADECPLEQVPGTRLWQCLLCEVSVPVPLAAAPHDATEGRSPRARRVAVGGAR